MLHVLPAKPLFRNTSNLVERSVVKPVTPQFSLIFRYYVAVLINHSPDLLPDVVGWNR